MKPQQTTPAWSSLQQAAKACLAACDPKEKCRLTQQAHADWQQGLLACAHPEPIEPIGDAGRPDQPMLVPPRDVPKRSLGTQEGRAALLHAIAHIEFNAINLAWDAVYRFPEMPRGFYDDFVATAADEARHFQLLAQRLAELDRGYGDYPAHNGLWSMAQKTAHDPLVRMALVPRVLEARGLDVTPGMIERLRKAGDEQSVAILHVILREEVAHVAAGTRWFTHLCTQRGLMPKQTFFDLVNTHAPGIIRPPINQDARKQAGFDDDELTQLLACFAQDLAKHQQSSQGASHG